MDYIFTFYTISEVLKFEKILNKAGIGVKLMPVPRKLSTSCGTCAQIGEKDLDEALKLVEREGLDYDEIFNMGEG